MSRARGSRAARSTPRAEQATRRVPIAAQADALPVELVHPLPALAANANALGYVCTTPEEGLAQLAVLRALGCQPHHRVLEIGCGALVAGFPIMQYLERCHYMGIDPNEWLTAESAGIPAVAAVIAVKQPQFHKRADFHTGTGQKFDFILAHSVLSHTSSVQFDAFLARAAEQLERGGVLAASLRIAEGNAFGSPGSARRGADFTEWQYPGVSWFARDDVLARAQRAGFAATIDLESTRAILRGNPKAIHDWLVGRRTSRRRVFLGVPCFAEDPDLLARALGSFMEPDVRVVAVDNGATPSVQAVLTELAEASADAIEVIHNAANVYVNPAWNQLAARFLESDAEVLVLANADLVASPGWSQSLLARLDQARGALEFWVGCGVAGADAVLGAPISAAVSTDPARHTAGAFFALPREAVAIALPIPDDLRVWYGDTWVQETLAAAGFTMVTLEGIRAWHAGAVSSRQLPDLDALVRADKERWQAGLQARAGETGRKHAAPPILLVSAFFRLRDRAVDEAEQFRRFDQLAASGLPILLFLDRQLADKAPDRPNVRVELVDLDALWSFQHAGDRPLPAHRTIEKDTREFLLLQNAKLDLIARASKLDRTASHFAWIDFGVMKVVHDPASFLDRLRALRPPPTCVLAPGCWDRQRSVPVDHDAVHWRFCGGFLLIDRGTIPALVERYHEAFARTRQLTWEVNVWAEMERRGQQFDWYRADHDDSLVGGVTGQRICLVMIVKNERAIIERCLMAALPYIDTWVIADTGSTDGTPEVITKFFGERSIPGKLVQTTFKNFAQARNESLVAARAVGGWDYALLIDADMVLTGSIDRPQLQAAAYRVQQSTGSLVYWNTRLVRRDVAATYIGVTHEFLSVTGETNLDSLRIDDRNDGGSKSDKGERDIRLLSEGLAVEPNNDRYMFYLANTYREAGRHHEAIQWYRRRIALGGWDEEVWAAYYGIARSYQSLGDEAALTLACFDAYNFRPTRAEPLALLARWWREHGKNDAAVLIAEQVARMPVPADILFVEPEAYGRAAAVDRSISGFYSKIPARRAAGHEACAALTIDRDANVRAEARKNFVFYAKSAHELFGAAVHAIDWKLIDGYAPMNPSALVLPDGRRLVLVRTVNYRVADGQYPTTDGSGIIRTRNWVVEVDAAWRPVRRTMLTDATGIPRTTYPVEGFEDCRIYPGPAGELAASATVRDIGDGRCELTLLALHESASGEWSVENARVIRDYEHDRAQKNWMPILGKPDWFLYLCDPTTVIDCAPGGTRVVTRVTDLDPDLTDFRGSSQVIPHADGWIGIVHEVAFTPGRVYLHRFIRLNAAFEILVVSEPFYFAERGIEFCAGLARDGDRLVASFGVNDESAHLAVFDAAAIDRSLCRLA